MEREYVELAQTGEVESFRRLVEQYSNAVYSVIYSKLGDFHIAQDITQETFLKAYLHMNRLREPKKIGGWLLTVASRLAVDWLRSNRNKPAVHTGQEPIDDGFDEMIQRRQNRSIVRGALSILDEESRIAVMMQMYGYALSEIGDFLQTTASAVDNRLRRAKRKLKEELIVRMEQNMMQHKLNHSFVDKVVGTILFPSDLFFPFDNLSGGVLEKVKRKFARRYPNVSLDMTTVTNYKDKLHKYMAEGTPPDIIVLGNHEFIEYERRGWMRDLRPYLEAEGVDWSHFVGSALDLCSVSGRILGIPMAVATTGVFYNRNWFDDAGLPYPSGEWTWEDFAGIAERLHAVHGDPEKWKYGASIMFHTNILEMLALSKGGRFISEDGSTIRGHLDSEETISALQWVADNIHGEKGFAPMIDYGFRRLFGEGRIGMIVDYVDAFSVIDNKMGEGFGVAPLPYFREGSRINVAGTGGLGISAAAKNPDMAWAFIRESLLRRSPLSEAYAEIEIGNTYALLRELGHDQDDRRAVFLNEFRHSVAGAMGSSSLWHQYYKQQINERLTPIITGNADVRETLRWAVEGIESHLEMIRSSF